MLSSSRTSGISLSDTRSGPSMGRIGVNGTPAASIEAAILPPHASTTASARWNSPSFMRIVNCLPSSRGGSIETTSRSHASRTPKSAAAARSTSTTTDALFASGYRRPSDSARHSSPKPSKKSQTNRSSPTASKTRCTKSALRYSLILSSRFEKLQRPLPVASIDRPTRSSRS